MEVKAICPKCGYEDTYEHSEFGLGYYQSVGECPVCGGDTVDEQGKPTRENVSFKVT